MTPGNVVGRRRAAATPTGLFHRIAPVAGVFLLALGGCARPPMPFPPEPLPMADAVAILNGNIAAIQGTLRASGTVDGCFVLPDGRRRTYHLDAVLFHFPPAHVRFDLKAFGSRQFLFGCDGERYWYYDKQEGTYHCGRGDGESASGGFAQAEACGSGSRGDFPDEIPVQPGQIIDALGLTPIPVGSPRVQRVTGDYQQILFLTFDEDGRIALEKEYWLDRYDPRLVRRVVFRDTEGVVIMESTLGDYRAPAGGDRQAARQGRSAAPPLLPHVMIATWPLTGAELRFRVTRWSQLPQIGPESIQFLPPRECGER